MPCMPGAGVQACKLLKIIQKSNLIMSARRDMVSSVTISIGNGGAEYGA